MLILFLAIQHLLQPKNSGTSLISRHPSSISNPSKIDQKNKKKEVEERLRTSMRAPAPSQEENSAVNTSGTSTVTHSEHKLKYKLIRVAVDAIDFWLVESGAALQLWVSNYSCYY